LVRNDARWATELKDPIHTRAAGREAIPFGYDEDRPNVVVTVRYHGGNRVHFGVYVV
jgi:hypothetical protein